MKHKVKVVMLPTENMTFLVINNHLATKANVEYRPDLVKQSTIIKSPITFQHVYITISQDIEPIEEGDWAIYNNSNGATMLCQAYKYKYNDEMLFDTNDNFFDRNIGEGITSLKNDVRKIIATTDIRIMTNQVEPYNMKQGYSKQIPQLQQSFLEEFVANPDGEWEVEYSTFPIGPNGNVIGTNSDYPYNGLISNFTIKYKHKLSQNNTIFISAVKKKMYSRKEVEVLINKYEEDTLYYGRDGYYKNIDIPEEWIKKNL